MTVYAAHPLSSAWSALLWAAVTILVLVVAAVVGALRASSRYRATKPTPTPDPPPPRVVAAGTYRRRPLDVWVAEAHHDSADAAVYPPTSLPVSPNPRAEES